MYFILIAKQLYFKPNGLNPVFQKNSKKGIIIPNPINVATGASKNKKKKLVSVGRLSEQKNQAMLIDAFAKVNEEHPEYQLFIYGEGHLRDLLSQQINELHLNDKVFLPGTVTNIHEVISDAEIFVLSSNYEGLSNALLEAMMMGLPCISTNCAGSNEIIKDEVNGLLIPIGDTERLTDTINKLITNKDFSSQLGNEAKTTAKMFDSKIVINKWENVIEQQ
ncbi:glycosyltransferase [Cytobacillus pseudoceanisediminis]|uniref:glycosyltransferase n=1 Tax=Cytobacillus pseudoceanisediminis TaxID=3051614 RepID=UPI0021856BFD|nr:glycosyltransferase [Cytobacillus pseudoceanisediminis]UQX53795.1 glycosyltransferase [Cytobacillus pseudoceanisediminis]